MLKPEDRIQTNGCFFDHDGATFGIGVSDGAIFVLFQNQLLGYEADFQTEIQETDEGRTLTAFRNGTTLARVMYLPNEPYWNFWPMEDEDVDGFLWIHNVLSSAERRAILLCNNDR